MPRVLDLDLREVIGRRAEHLHPAPGVQREVRGVRRAEETEAQPVRIVAALARVRREEALRGGVGSDHERHVAQPGQDLRPRGVQRGRAARARGVRRRDRRALPAEGLRERRAGDVAGVAVAHRVRPGHELDVAPLDPRVGQCRLRGDDAVLDEVAAPLPPGVHADPEDRDLSHRVPVRRAHAGLQLHTTYS